MLNLSAPFIPQFFKVQLEELLPYCDVLIGNESEAEAWALASGLPDTKDLSAVAKALAGLKKVNASRPRTVIFTQGSESTILVSSTHPDKPQVFKVNPLKAADIVDTNGAGDAFAGGFLGALVANKSVEEAVEIGHKLGAMCVQEVNHHMIESQDLRSSLFI